MEILSFQGCQEQVNISLPQVWPARLSDVYSYYVEKKKKLCLCTYEVCISYSRSLPPIVFQHNVNNYHIVKGQSRRNFNPTAVLFYIDIILVLRNKVKMEYFYATSDRVSECKALESFLESSM